MEVWCASHPHPWVLCSKKGAAGHTTQTGGAHAVRSNFRQQNLAKLVVTAAALGGVDGCSPFAYVGRECSEGSASPPADARSPRDPNIKEGVMSFLSAAATAWSAEGWVSGLAAPSPPDEYDQAFQCSTPAVPVAADVFTSPLDVVAPAPPAPPLETATSAPPLFSLEMLDAIDPWQQTSDRGGGPLVHVSVHVSHMGALHARVGGDSRWRLATSRPEPPEMPSPRWWSDLGPSSGHSSGLRRRCCQH